MRKPKNYSGFLKVTEAFGTKTEPDFVHTPAALAPRTKIQRRGASLRSPGSAVISTVARRFPRAGDFFLWCLYVLDMASCVFSRHSGSLPQTKDCILGWVK